MMGLLQDRRLHAFLVQSFDGLCITDAAGTVLEISPAALRILGYAAEECHQQELFCRIHPEDQEKARAAFVDCGAYPEQPTFITIRCQHRYGGWRWLEACCTSRLSDPAINAVVVTFRDVTERQEAATTLGMRAKVLEYG